MEDNQKREFIEQPKLLDKWFQLVLLVPNLSLNTIESATMAILLQVKVLLLLLLDILLMAILDKYQKAISSNHLWSIIRQGQHTTLPMQ